MRWPWRHHDPDEDRRLAEASARLAQLRERAERVMPLIDDRQRRNGWTETVQSIVRGGT